MNEPKMDQTEMERAFEKWWNYHEVGGWRDEKSLAKLVWDHQQKKLVILDNEKGDVAVARDFAREEVRVLEKRIKVLEEEIKWYASDNKKLLKLIDSHAQQDNQGGG